MENEKKYALLDADFIIKTVRAQKDGNNHLIDLLLDKLGYEFICHEKTVDEVSYTDGYGTEVWLKDKIENGRIKALSDSDILDLLGDIYHDGAINWYREYLKRSCDAFKFGYFEENFSGIDVLPDGTDKSLFLEELSKADERIGIRQSLGEKKSLVLLQVFQLLYPGNVYVFCSDDGGARNGVVSVTRTHCISVLSAFYHLMKRGVKKDEATVYYQSFVDSLVQRQNSFKVYNAKGDERIKVSFEQIIEDIYADKFEANAIGFLRYKA